MDRHGEEQGRQPGMTEVTPTLLPGLHCIALPTPFEVGAVNTYLAEGDPLTLIDCGVNTEDSYRALVEGLATLDYRVRDIRRLIITHHHYDHTGLAQRIVEESSAEVWAHPWTVPWLESPQAARQREHQFTEGVFREGGVPAEVIELMGRVSQHLARLVGRAPVTRTVDEGDTVGLLSCDWRIYHTPGHAGDLICLFQPEARLLLASDHLLLNVSSNPLLEAPATQGEARPRRLLEYIREMQRMAGLDIQIAYTGHGGPIQDVRGLVDSRLAFHQQRAERLYRLFDGEPHTLYELAKRLFPNVRAEETFLILSETLGHIDLLEQDGLLGREARGQVVWWAPTGQGNREN